VSKDKLKERLYQCEDCNTKPPESALEHDGDTDDVGNVQPSTFCPRCFSEDLIEVNA